MTERERPPEIKLILGDCRERMAEIPDGTVALTLVDPPYGISYQSARRTDKATWFPKIANDETPFIDWLPEAYRVGADGSALACFCPWKTQDGFFAAISAAGFTVRSQVVWDRESHGMGDLEGEFAPQHDIVWFATKGSFKFPGKRPKSVIRCDRVPPNKLRHPNEKPIRLLIDLINTLSPPHSLILDPCVGSGSTLVACMKTGRRGIGIEIDPNYVEIARRRLKAAETPLFSSIAEPDE